MTLVMVAMMVLPAMLRAEDPPTEWIDKDTGHRVVRLCHCVLSLEYPSFRTIPRLQG